MKNRFCRILALVCLLAAALPLCGSAWAETAELKSTQTFLDFLEEKGIKYSYIGKSGRHEEVDVTYEMDHFPSLTCELHFKDDLEEVSLRVWNIVNASAGKNFILSALNSINNDYKFVKFVFDESDSTVQAELDVYIDADTCGRSVYDSMMALFTVTDKDDVAEKLHSLE